MSEKPPPDDDLPRCPYCGRMLETVHVHGHAQCSHCGMIFDPCCAGDPAAQPPLVEPTAGDDDVPPGER
jgi:hypothetical protein